MFTPAKILKLWNRVIDRFGFAEEDDEGGGNKSAKTKTKPSPKLKQAEKENTRIGKGLTKLRRISQGDLSDPGTAGKFTKTQDKTVKSMKKFCKLLKSNDLKESVEDLTKLRKSVKQLTIVVENLGTGPFEEDGGAEADLGLIQNIDTAKIDQALEDPKFGEYSDEELADLDKEEEEGDVPPAPPLSSADKAKYDARWKALEPAMLQALKEQRGDVGKMRAVATFANDKAASGDYTKGLQGLDSLEALLKAAGVGLATAPEPPPGEDAAYQARLKMLLTQSVPVSKDDPALGQELKLLLSESQVFARKKDFAQANGILEQVQAKLRRGAIPPAPPPPPAKDGAGFAARLKALMVQAVPVSKANADVGQQLKALFTEAQNFDRNKDAAQATAALDRAEALLKKQGDAAESKPTGSKVDFAKAKLEWNAAKRDVGSQLGKLKSSILGEFPEEAKVVTRLDEILQHFNEGLGDALDDLYNAADDNVRKQTASKALGITASYLKFVETDKLVTHVENHPFESAPVTIRDVLLPTLKKIQQQLKV